MVELFHHLHIFILLKELLKCFMTIDFVLLTLRLWFFSQFSLNRSRFSSEKPSCKWVAVSLSPEIKSNATKTSGKRLLKRFPPAVLLSVSLRKTFSLASIKSHHGIFGMAFGRNLENICSWLDFWSKIVCHAAPKSNVKAQFRYNFFKFSVFSNRIITIPAKLWWIWPHYPVAIRDEIHRLRSEQYQYDNYKILTATDIKSEIPTNMQIIFKTRLKNSIATRLVTQRT